MVISRILIFYECHIRNVSYIMIHNLWAKIYDWKIGFKRVPLSSTHQFNIRTSLFQPLNPSVQHVKCVSLTQKHSVQHTHQFNTKAFFVVYFVLNWRFSRIELMGVLSQWFFVSNWRVFVLNWLWGLKSSGPFVLNSCFELRRPVSNQ